MTRPVVVISGSRNLTDPAVVRAAMERALQRDPGKWDWPALTTWLHGGAAGVDLIVGALLRDDDFAYDYGLEDDTVEVMRPVYDSDGRRAPLIRNERMIERAQATGGALIAIWDGQSRGTAYTIRQAAFRKVPVYIEIVYSK